MYTYSLEKIKKSCKYGKVRMNHYRLFISFLNISIFPVEEVEGKIIYEEIICYLSFYYILLLLLLYFFIIMLFFFVKIFDFLGRQNRFLLMLSINLPVKLHHVL